MKTSAVGALTILLGLIVIFPLIFILTPLIPQYGIGFWLGLGIGLIIVIYGIYRINKKAVPEWKVKSNPKAKKLANLFVVSIFVALVLMILFPSIFMSEIGGIILQIYFFIVFISYGYYRFVKKQN